MRGAEQTDRTRRPLAEGPRASAERPRLFVAVEFPEEAKEALAGLVRALRGLQIEGLCPVRAEGIHLTLKFLGEVSADRVSAIADALARAARTVAPGQVELRGIGGFPDLETPRVLWVGLAGDLDPLEALHQSAEEALAPLGHPPDRRPFTPHLTLARLREGTRATQRRLAGQTLKGLSWPEGAPVPVAAVSLVQSTLPPQGAEYRTLHRAPLGGASSEPGTD